MFFADVCQYGRLTFTGWKWRRPVVIFLTLKGIGARSFHLVSIIALVRHSSLVFIRRSSSTNPPTIWNHRFLTLNTCRGRKQLLLSIVHFQNIIMFGSEAGVWICMDKAASNTHLLMLQLKGATVADKRSCVRSFSKVSPVKKKHTFFSMLYFT